MSFCILDIQHIPSVHYDVRNVSCPTWRFIRLSSAFVFSACSRPVFVQSTDDDFHVSLVNDSIRLTSLVVFRNIHRLLTGLYFLRTAYATIAYMVEIARIKGLLSVKYSVVIKSGYHKKNQCI